MNESIFNTFPEKVQSFLKTKAHYENESSDWSVVVLDRSSWEATENEGVFSSKIVFCSGGQFYSMLIYRYDIFYNGWRWHKFEYETQTDSICQVSLVEKVIKVWEEL